MNKKWIITLAILQVSAVLTACSGRQKEAEADSEAISFETTDLDGNVVKSGDLFKGHRLTMVNIWGTFCGPCISEEEHYAFCGRKRNTHRQRRVLRDEYIQGLFSWMHLL